jgi:O-antigen ligase
MWDAAWRGLMASPYTGTGVGTYRDVYGLFATGFIPYVVDRAHNDILEFAMGAGLPAALAWYAAFLFLAVLCARGVLKRHRRRIYALTAVGAIVLVAFHSLFDFSLQMPAVSVLFAAVLGVGLGQCMPSRGDAARGSS